jgi:RNA polymerase sigma-70 factor (ECF subfamily)
LTGSDAQLDAWIREIAPRAVAYARTLLKRPDRAEDVVQDVMMRLLDHEDYDLLEDGEKLVFRSVTNACINATTRRRELLSLDAESAGGWSLADEVASDAAPDPADAAVERELMERVEQELRALPPMQRAAVELKAMGRTLKQIAATLDVSDSNAGVLVHRGRERLKQNLGSRLPGELR